jgi:hypothetical protein
LEQGSQAWCLRLRMMPGRVLEPIPPLLEHLSRSPDAGSRRTGSWGTRVDQLYPLAVDGPPVLAPAEAPQMRHPPDFTALERWQP